MRKYEQQQAAAMLTRPRLGPKANATLRIICSLLEISPLNANHEAMRNYVA